MRIRFSVACIAMLAGCAHGGGFTPSPMLWEQPLAGINYKSLYSFQSGEDAGYPYAGLTDVNGTLYGTTYGGGGGYEWGTVFSITTGGAEHVLYRFKAGNDGAHPYGGLLDLNGVLYGTTYQGGTSGSGTVFSITTAGKERVIYSFKGGSDGQYPYSHLLDLNGTMYGTTWQGGVSTGWGTVFKVSTTGSEHVLYRFKAGNDGAHPYPGLTALGGKLYGTTYQGGKSGSGTVYSITPSGIEHVVYSFKGGSDGQYPEARLLALDGELYGTTYQGGVSTGWGTVFKVSTSGQERVLYAFKAGKDGAHPQYAGVTALNGTLYGTTYQGGASGAGTVFSLNAAGQEHVVYSFQGSPDGQYPYAGLVVENNVLYGTTYAGGTNNAGTVFRLSP